MNHQMGILFFLFFSFPTFLQRSDAFLGWIMKPFEQETFFAVFYCKGRRGWWEKKKTLQPNRAYEK